MKKITFPDMLDLSKETIANLSEEQLHEIEGGAAAVEQSSCFLQTCNTATVTDYSTTQEGE